VRTRVLCSFWTLRADAPCIQCSTRLLYPSSHPRSLHLLPPRSLTQLARLLRAQDTLAALKPLLSLPPPPDHPPQGMEHIQSEGTCPARGSATTLIIAGHVLPLACVDDFNVDRECVVEGVERMLAPPPLLVNLGKASTNAWFHQ
jgi:hypothetical protein